MKMITNECVQSLEVYLTSIGGAKRIWMRPRETVVVPSSFISSQIQNLTQKRLLSVRNA
jgi:hypothetical protein